MRIQRKKLKIRRAKMNKLRLLFREPSHGLCSSRLFNNETFYAAFVTDLKHARSSVLIESPFITTRRMNSLLPVFERLRRLGVQVIVNTRNPNEHDAEYAAQALVAVRDMQDIGIRVLYTVKHHRKLVIVDDILWEGSLNILSQNDSCEVMRRSVSLELVSQMRRFIYHQLK